MSETVLFTADEVLIVGAFLVTRTSPDFK
jgi:hypothetical protein